jgi:hypothetical protein
MTWDEIEWHVEKVTTRRREEAEALKKARKTK